MRVLVCCKDPGRPEPLLGILGRLNLGASPTIVLLTVVGKKDQPSQAETPSVPHFPLPLTHRVRQGSVVPEILSEASDGGFQLVVCGWHHHRTGLGSTAERLFRACPTDLLLVRPSERVLEQALMCTAGEPPSLATMHSAAKILDQEHVRLAILHVMSQVAFSDSSPHDDLIDSAERAMRRGTREGLHLRQALEVFAGEQFRGRVQALLRHGLVVDEVLAELREGQYDLLVIGSRPPRRARRWKDLLLEDVGAELAWRAHSSVLLIRPPAA